MLSEVIGSIFQVFLNSKLTVTTLGQIWTLADIDADGYLDREEFFIVSSLLLHLSPIASSLSFDHYSLFVSAPWHMIMQAMHFIYKCLNGEDLPKALPANLIPPSKRRPSSTNSFQSSSIASTSFASASSNFLSSSLHAPTVCDCISIWHCINICWLLRYDIF